MSATILCHGCGGRVSIPDDYARARIRCPECGVMSDVPAAAQRQAGGDKPRRPRPAAETDAAAEEILLGNDPPPPSEPKPAKRKPVQAVQVQKPRAPGPLHPLPPSPNEQASDDEDDGRPYRVPGLDDERPCPECRKTIARDAGFCTYCGYNLQTGRKAKQEFETVEREWQGGWPVKLRLGLFIGAVVLYLTACVISVVAGAPIFGAFFPCLLFVGMTAFLLGTYDHIRLTRNKKGRVRLTKTWTICFSPRPPRDVDVNEYGGVVYGPYDETSIMEWLILIIMLVPLIIPGILWLYFVFIRTTFQVALSKEHGYPELVLYRGSNQKMVIDIAETVRNVAHLPKA